MSRILVIRGGALGDFLLTLPAIHLLRQGCEASIEILGYEPFLGLAKSIGLANETRSMEHAALAPFFAPGAALDTEWCEYFSQFSVVVSYLFDPDGSFAGNLERAGVTTLIEGPHKPVEGGRHAAVQLADPLSRLALFLEPGDEAFVAGERDPNATPSIAIHPGSGSPQKNWGLDSWIELGRQISTRHPDTDLLLVTGEVEEEHGLAEVMVEAWSDLPHRHLRARSLAEVADEMKKVTRFIGQDSGVTHLASVLGVPCIVLFGPTDPRVWAPAHQETVIIEAPSHDFSQLQVETVLESL